MELENRSIARWYSSKISERPITQVSVKKIEDSDGAIFLSDKFNCKGAKDLNEFM